MDISSNKQVKDLYMINNKQVNDLDMINKGRGQERNWIFSNSWTE